MPMTGWLSTGEDRDYLRNQGLVFAPARRFGAPAEFDTRSIIAVENQSNTNSCVGHGTSSGMEACAWIAAGAAGDAPPDQFSRWFAYRVAQQQSGITGDNGATISGAAQAMKSIGCCHESTWPFPGRYVKPIPQAATAEANQFKIAVHTSLEAYQSVFDFMSGGFGAVVIGIAWTSRLANNTSGVIELNDVQGRGGGHCVLLWGWSKRVDSQGRHYIWLHNSHGKGWGNGGRAEVSPECIDFWGRSRNNEMIGFSDLSGFDKPRRIDFSRIV